MLFPYNIKINTMPSVKYKGEIRVIILQYGGMIVKGHNEVDTCLPLFLASHMKRELQIKANTGVSYW